MTDGYFRVCVAHKHNLLTAEFLQNARKMFTTKCKDLAQTFTLLLLAGCQPFLANSLFKRLKLNHEPRPSAHIPATGRPCRGP